MNLHSALQRWFSPALFALAALAFLLPFATVSCDGAETTFTGVQLVTETVPPAGTIASGEFLDDRIENDASKLAMSAFASAVLGFALAALGRKGAGWLAASGLVSSVLLGANAFQPFGPTVVLHSGYWLTLLLFLCAAVLHASRALRRRRASRNAGGVSVLGDLREEAP
jgi:hypothetical protein